VASPWSSGGPLPMNAPREPVRCELQILAGEELYDEVVLRGLLRATEKVRVVTANLKNFFLDEGLTRRSAVTAIRELAGAGVSVEILHGGVPTEPFLHEIKTGPPMPPGRFEMKFCPRVHWKAVVIDYKTLYVGSANFTGAGIGARDARSRNFELGFLTGSEALLDEANALFDRIWTGEECVSCLRRKECPEPLEGFRS
jgi:phosphatidylserine/phosphatidylglycerophosphate/cardiolipin synthase-like enzyme